MNLRVKLVLDTRMALLVLGLSSFLLCNSASPALHFDTQNQSAAAVYVPQTPGRHVYLTQSVYQGSQAKSACTSGYHMASLWEILDISSVKYDFNHPDATTKSDSGYGPPAGWYGWLRTGQDANSNNSPGSGNCQSWTLSDPASFGSAARLANTWEVPPAGLKPWGVASFVCNTTGPVWCAGDFSILYIPVIR